MKHKSKGFEENPVIWKGKKIYKHQKLKKIKKVLQNAWQFRGHPFFMHTARCPLGTKAQIPEISALQKHTSRLLLYEI